MIGLFFWIRSSYIGDYSSLKPNRYTIKISNNLRDFTINNPQYVNTIPEFIKLAKSLSNDSYVLKNIGCLQDGTRKFIEIEEGDMDGTLCNANIPDNIDGMLDSLWFFDSLDSSDINIKNARKDLLALYNEDLKRGITRYCYLPVAWNCAPYDVFIYEKNRVYYLQWIIYTVLWLWLIFLLLQFVYYKWRV